MDFNEEFENMTDGVDVNTFDPENPSDLMNAMMLTQTNMAMTRLDIFKIQKGIWSAILLATAASLLPVVVMVWVFAVRYVL